MTNNKSTYRILHVDDDIQFIELVKLMLNDKLFSIDNAYDGSDAVSQAFSNKYDLILMDIMMPVVDGIQASITIKKMSPNIPIIALTAFDVVQLDGLKQFDYIIRKPVTKNILRKSIIEIIEKK